MKRFGWILVILLSLLVFIGCSAGAVNNEGVIEVIVSRDFGKEELSSKRIDVAEGQTVLDILEENFEIETAYGGSFVNGIDGLKSGFTNQKKREKIDWFYYVNGILTQVGAGDYEIRTGDVVIWDYHYWDNANYLSSMIGAYPNNFVNGYDGNVLNVNILCIEGYEQEGEKLQAYLTNHGVGNVESSNVDEEVLQDDGINTIVIGPWDELLKYEYISELYENREKAGLFFEIDESIAALDHDGNRIETFDKGAVIASALKGYGVMSTIWLITGNDEACIKEGVHLLYENPEKIKGLFSVIKAENEWIHLPMNE